MLERNISTVLNDQRQFFAKDATKSIAFRLEQLKKLKRLLDTHEAAIAEAIHQDLGKSPEEALLTEILLVKKEIKFAIDNLKSWAKPVKQTTPFSLWLGRSEVHMEPYGSVCIIGPWNYPFLLVMLPLVGAMAAGNCVVIKPSEITTHTQDLILQLINSNFPSEYIYAHAGNPEKTTLLLQEKFDYLFFTGGARIGKIIMEAAAKHLTPVTLELGGKSPCIIDETANLDFAARRVAWGKTINAGQTCIAPDYLYIHE
jgi:aldehyde dehydrogenase (NAD+)